MQRIDSSELPFANSKLGSFGIVVVVAATLIFVSAVTWYAISQSQNEVIEYQARDLAETVAELATTMRSAYTSEVVQKLKKDGSGSHLHSEKMSGYVPLPAQFLKEVGKLSSSKVNGLYSYQPVSRWNLEKTQGLKDDFQRWAWQQLESQDSNNPTGPIDWQPIWRIEQVNGVSTLRYMRADPATSRSCVECHNSMEQSPEIRLRRQSQRAVETKQWKLHQLLGALEVQIPIDRVVAVASGQTSGASRQILGVFAASLIAIFALVYANGRRIRDATRRLHWQVNHDLLTGLKNRYALETELEYWLKNPVEGQQRSLIFLDLDRFKIINDTCGHGAGDTLLKQISSLLVDKLSASDLVARVGGDEFIILLSDHDIDSAREIAERLRQEIRDYRLNFDNQVFGVGVSIGVVPVDSQADSIEDVIGAADVACYVAKSSGRNRVHVSKVINDESLQRHRDTMQWASTITTSVENNHFRLATQRAESLNKSLPRYFHEVLLRLEDGSGFLLSTHDLIAAAERFDMTQDIDRWVVNTAFASIHAGIIPCDKDNIVAINLSANSITSNRFLDYLKQSFQRYDSVDPTAVCFEITETSAVRNVQSARVFVKSLKDLGCSVALDDFGSGFNSFSSLKSLTFDYLKIDGEFVRDYESDPLDKAIVEAAIHFGKVMGIPVIAEWVETPQVRDRLAALGVAYVQGHAIHEPTIVEFPDLSASTSSKDLRNVA